MVPFEFPNASLPLSYPLGGVCVCVCVCACVCVRVCACENQSTGRGFFFGNNNKNAVPAVVEPSTPATPVLDTRDPGLRALLSSDCLAIQRELEFANILIGYEQANRYSIRDRQGQIIGFICEVGDGIGKAIVRNLAATHRTFQADVLDPQGRLLLRITKPLHLIQSNLLIENDKAVQIGQVKMDWHVWKRRYDLFYGAQPVGRVDGEFLAWEFTVKNEVGERLAVVDRNWMGLGRELIADAGRYVIYFGSGGDTSVDRFDPAVSPPNSLFSFTSSTPFPEQASSSSPSTAPPAALASSSRLPVATATSPSPSPSPSPSSSTSTEADNSSSGKPWWENLPQARPKPSLAAGAATPPPPRTF
jgi:uncharacterized protein YxjI